MTEVDYTARDFDSIVQSLLRRAKTVYGDRYTDFSQSSQAQMLVDLVAYASATLHYYMDRRSQDGFLTTATTIEGAERSARQLGYKPRNAVASSVDLVVTFAALAGNGKFRKGFRFSTTAGIEYEVVDDVVVLSGATTATVPVRQSKTKSISFTSDGSKNQQFTLPTPPSGEYYLHESIRVVVNGIEWTEVVLLSWEMLKEFEAYYSNRKILFGDGLSGEIPPNGSTVKVWYSTTQGKAGSVFANTIKTALDVFSVGGSTVPLTSISHVAAFGGDDPESLEQIRSNAPSVFRAQDVCILKSDYEALARAYSHPDYGAVAQATAVNVRSEREDLHLAGLMNEWLLVSNGLNDTVNGVRVELESLIEIGLGKLELLNVALADLASGNTSSNGLAVSMYTSSLALSSSSGSISGALNVIESIINEMTVTIGALGAGPEKTALLEATSQMSAIVTNALTTSSSQTAAASSLLTTATSLLSRLSSNAALLAEADGLSADLSSNLGLIGAQSALLVTVQSEIDFESAKEAVQAYLDELFDADCKANVVSVPILARDAEGFYAAPSGGLIRSLQAYLSERKEVTQQVVVTNGGSALVYANLTVQYKLNATYDHAVVLASLQTAVDSVLRSRKFGKSLREFEIYKAIDDAIADGLEYVQVTLEGPNLQGQAIVIGDWQIVTKGTVTFEKID